MEAWQHVKLSLTNRSIGLFKSFPDTRKRTYITCTDLNTSWIWHGFYRSLLPVKQR